MKGLFWHWLHVQLHAHAPNLHERGLYHNDELLSNLSYFEVWVVATTWTYLKINIKSVCVCCRAGRVHELTESSHSKFKMIWHQFSTVQFPSNQLVWKVCSVQFWACGPSASIQLSSVQARFCPLSLQLFGSSRGTVLGPLQQKSQPAGQGFVAWAEGWCALLAVLAYLSGMWCGVRVMQIQSKNHLQKVCSVQFACLIGSTASSFSSVHELFQPWCVAWKELTQNPILTSTFFLQSSISFGGTGIPVVRLYI